MLNGFERKLSSGELLFKQGDPPDEVYMVKDGKIRIYLDRNGEKKQLAVISEGEFIGEMAIIDGKPRSASAEAIEDCVVLVLNRQSIQKQIEEDPLMGALISTLVRRLRNMDRKLSR
ncbi:MAG: cyclic nucleotide-binding domain-containing protein [candidate division WOR-3 bacterium]|nr:cyclic nucleotide-binding domain-containing protein [candidate division WOR-3 bacterium]